MERKIDVIDAFDGKKMVPELIEIATEKAHKDNYKEKHNKDAKYGLALLCLYMIAMEK